MKTPRGESASEEIAAPSRIESGHVRNRAFINDQGQISQKKAWRRIPPVQAAFERGQLSGGAAKYTPEYRLAAGLQYGVIFDRARSPGRDSTDLLRIVGSAGHGGGAGLGAGLGQVHAIRQLARIYDGMGNRDREIIRLVCGEGYFPAEAIRHVCGDYRDTVMARLREALDGLIEAMEAARKSPAADDRGTNAKAVR